VIIASAVSRLITRDSPFTESSSSLCAPRKKHHDFSTTLKKASILETMTTLFAEEGLA
jgi:hypothetical protein